MPETFFPADSFGGITKKPVRFEADVFECEVVGAIPRELSGALYRVGGDREFPSLESDNIINGDGLMSMFRFQDGHVSFRMRYVKTERLLQERAARRRLYGHYRNRFTDHPAVASTDRDNTANTYAFHHHGNLYMLREDSHPYRVDPATLETLAVDHFDGKLKSKTMTAHPKIDPRTGEWWSMGLFASKEPYKDMSLHVIDEHGQVIREEWFDMPIPGITHDWAVTREHLVFPIMPITVDMSRVRSGGRFYAYDPAVPSMWGVMAREGSVRDIRWFKIPGITIGHIMNAFTEGGVVHVDATVAHGNVFSFFPSVSGEKADPESGATTITRLSFDLNATDARAVTLTTFDGALGDMPRLDERFAMSKYRYGYFASRRLPYFGVGQLDWNTHEMKIHAMPDSLAQEPVFVERDANAPEGDGFVLSVVNRHRENRADLVVLDGRDVSRPPLATVKLPFDLSFQFHGCFVRS